MEFRLLRSDEIDVRVASIDKTWCTLLLYKDARVDMNVLDETVGSMNWQKRYVRENANCIVAIWDESKSQWVEKEDTGTESFSEAEKGLASDSFKRACFNWGIGRELYTSPTIFVTPRKDMGSTKKADAEPNEFFVTGTDSKGKEKYSTKTRFYVDYISYEDRNIQGLIIRDHKGNIRFEQLTDAEQKSMNEQFKKLQSLITANEDKDDNFDREELYKYFKVSSDAQLNLKQREKAIELLEKRLKK